MFSIGSNRSRIYRRWYLPVIILAVLIEIAVLWAFSVRTR